MRKQTQYRQSLIEILWVILGCAKSTTKADHHCTDVVTDNYIKQQTFKEMQSCRAVVAHAFIASTWEAEAGGSS